MNEGNHVSRTYLYVPPEENAEVNALGAVWDTESMCWYISAAEDPARFAKWLSETEEGAEFSFISSLAYVASATVTCGECGSSVEVICIHCERGSSYGEPLVQFTISDVSAIDDTLAEKLAPWPNFKKVEFPDTGESYFANYCPHCGVQVEDLNLHSEVDQPFFDIASAYPESVKLTPLMGQIQLNGSEHFEVG
jgi:hypothetical protein